jgi:hypothetical protein
MLIRSARIYNGTMKINRVAIYGTLAGVAWLVAFGAFTSAPQSEAPIAPMAAPQRAPVRHTDGPQSVAPLRPVERPTVRPNSGSRNPFSFDTRPPEPIVSSFSPPPVVETRPREERPLFTLIGMAEEGETRTAIISGLDQLFLVKVGDMVTGRYQVAAIGTEAVELTDLSGGTTLRLALR